MRHGRVRPAAGIARRLAFTNMAASGAALALACLTLMTYDFITFRTMMLRNRTVQAQIIGANTVTALTFDDPVAAESTLEALRAAPHVEAIGLYRPDGTLFASYRRDADMKLLALPAIPADEPDWYRYEGLTRLHVVRRVDFEGMPLGVVYIHSDQAEVTERLSAYALIVGIVLLVAIVTSQVIGRLATRSISRPIVELAAVATQLTADRNYAVRVTARGDDEIGVLIASFNEMLEELRRRDKALQESHDLLEQRVLDRTEALSASNQELEAFCYSVSHDLRSPLRSIDGFSQALIEDLEGKLDEDAQGHLKRIRAATQRMGTLIDDLLNLSRVSRTELTLKSVDLTAIARRITDEHRLAQPGRQVSVAIADDLIAEGDPRLLRQVLENLLGNALKFTSRIEHAEVQFGVMAENGSTVYFVKDNGAGFDPRFADRMFGVFQRLHGMTEFPGTGVGLAIVDRIVRRHGGRVWADAVLGGGATFFFTLGSPSATQKKAA